VTEAAGWIVAVLVVVVAVLFRCIERGRSERDKRHSAAFTDSIVSAQRRTIIDAAQTNLDRLSEGLAGDDPEGAVADAANQARSDR